MASAAASEIQEILAVVGEQPGWRIRQTGNNHHQVFPPPETRRPPFTVSCTPNGDRWRRVLLADLKRRGFDYEAFRGIGKAPAQRSAKQRISVHSRAENAPVVVEAVAFDGSWHTVEMLWSNEQVTFACKACPFQSDSRDEAVEHHHPLEVVKREPGTLPTGRGQGATTSAILKATMSDGSIEWECGVEGCTTRFPKATSAWAHKGRAHRAPLATASVESEEVEPEGRPMPPEAAVEQPVTVEAVAQPKPADEPEPVAAEAPQPESDVTAEEPVAATPAPSEPGIGTILSQAAAMIAQAQSWMARQPSSSAEVARLNNALDGQRDRNDTLTRKLAAKEEELIQARRRIEQLEDAQRVSSEGKAQLLDRTERAEEEARTARTQLDSLRAILNGTVAAVA